jgi:hypothetical protein
MAEDQISIRTRRFESLKEKLKSPSSNIPETITHIKEFLDKFSTTTPDQPNHFGSIIPDLLEVLRTLPCKFTSCPENTARLNILEIIIKCPNFEIIRNYYIHLFKATEDVMVNDNEDNSSLAIKLFVDLTKSYKEMVVDNTIIKFIKFADTMFKKSEEIARIAIERAARNDLVPAQESFKVLIECGSAITSLYHHYQRIVPIKEFITLAFDIVTRDDPKDINKHNKVYNEFILCKTKTFSFLAQFAQSEQINKDLRVPSDKLPSVLLKMMRTIPPEYYNIKKDLFQGFALIIKSPTHKNSFSRHIDSLLEENEISGNSSSIRAAWYTSMLEFIEIFKNDMSIEQLSKSVALVCRNIHNFSMVQTPSLNTIKSLLESIRNIKEKGARTSITNTIESMYTIILTALSKRLSYYKNIMEDIRESKIKNIKTNINISEPSAHFKKISDIAKMVINEKYYSSGQPVSINWDQNTVKLITKIIKNMIIAARVYPEYRLDREEAAIYESVSLILYTINGTQSSQNIFHDIFSTLLPFLFLSSFENPALYKLFESLSRSFKDNNKCIGDCILPFIIDNLEIMEQDSPLSETKVMGLCNRAKLSMPPGYDKVQFRKKLGKRLGDLLEMMLVPEVLEVHGKRLIQKCEELCKEEIITKYVLIAKNCEKNVFNNKTIRNELATPWLQQQDPLLLSNPPFYLISAALKSSDKISQACTLLDENHQSIKLTPEITKRLFELIHKPSSTQKEILKIIGKYGNNIRNCKQAIPVKAWTAPPNILTDLNSYPYSFTFTLLYDPLYPPIKIPLDYIINKINNSFKSKINVDEGQKKTVIAASKIISISILNLLSKLSIDTKLVVNKISSIILKNKDFCIYNKPKIPLIHSLSFTQTLKSAIEVLISLLAFTENVEELSELYETVFIHMGFLMFSSLEGEYTDIGFNTLDILEILCEKLAYLEKDNDKRFKASLKGLNTIITTVAKILHRNESALYKSETIKQILLALIRTCYKQDWAMQFGACGGLFRLLKGFPLQTIKDFSLQLMKTSLHVLQSVSSICKSQLSEEIIQLFSAVYEHCEPSKVVSELALGLSSQSSNLRHICRKLLTDYKLIPELFKLHISVYNPSNKTIADQLKDLIFSQPLKYAHISNRTMLLEAFNFCIQKKILTFSSHKSEIIAFMNSLLENCIDDNLKEKDPKKITEDSPEKTLNEKISAFECMKTILGEESLWDLIKEKDKECEELRYSITFKFLRAMSHHSDQHMIYIVKSGIESLLKREENSRHILPQDQLKTCLRPILMDLAKANNLPTLQLIQNFSRLLEVISDCFNVNLGNRLIAHLNKIEPQTKDLLPLIPAIANLFYLMPKCTEEILSSVIQGFIKAEENLQRNQLQGFLNSYFTIPLIRYLSRFPEKTMKHFFEEKKNIKCFINLIHHPMGYPLRDIAAKQFYTHLRPMLESLDPKEVFDIVRIINSLVKYMPRWISTKPDIIQVLQRIYNDNDSNIPESEILEKSYLHKYILKAFISFIRYNHKFGIKNVLLDLPIAYSRKNIWNLGFLDRFLRKELVKLLNLNEKRSVLKFIMKFLHDPTSNNEKKTKVLEYLMLPFIGECFKDPNKIQIVNKSLHISTIRLIRKHLNDFSNTCCVQLMSLGSMLIENFEAEFFHYRKELIKFYWGMIKSDNPFIKGSAYVNVARFIGVYSLPDSLTVQLLGALFKAHHGELVQSAHLAFSYLSGKLITFFQEARFREYLTDYVKKYLYHETRQFQSMIHVIDIIIKNANVFYYIRDGLISHFLNWINHLGLGLHSNYNAKKTLLELTAVMIDFSEQHFKDNGDSYINPSHKEMLINFFARFGQAPALYISRNPQRSFEQMNVLSIKCISNMKNALRLWGEVNFKAKNWTEALKKCVNLVQQHQQRNNAADALKKLLERSLSIIKILSEHNTRVAIIQYPELIKYLALQVKSTDNPLLIKSLCETVAILLTHPAEDLRKQLNEILESGFLSDSSQNCFWTIKLLYVVIETFPADITIHMKGLLSLTINLVRDLAFDSQQKEIKIETVQNSLKILQSSIPQLNEDNKKFLKQILSMIFEIHADYKIITDACKVMEKWLEMDDEDLCFSVKDQCNILMKIFSTFKLDIKHANLPLELAVKILSSQSDCYEPRILLCKAVLQYLLKDPSNEYKPQFNDILKDLMGMSLWRRLLFVFDQSDTIESKIWTKSSLDILLGGLEDSVILENDEMDEEIDVALDKNTAELLRQHFKYIKKNKSKYGKELINHIRQLLNFPISNMLFTHIFPQIWSSLSVSQQNSLVYSIENMLLNKLPPEPSDTNSGKTILVAISGCVPLPYIRPEILQYLSKVYNAWNICMPLLETYAAYLKDPCKSISYLENLHTRLNEREYKLGYQIERCLTPKCKEGVKLALTNKWEDSRSVFASVMEENLEDAEIAREGWEESSERLGDWNLLIKYCEHKQDLSLIEYYWQDKRYNEMSLLSGKLNINNHPAYVYYRTMETLENKNVEDLGYLKDLETELENTNNGIIAEWVALPKHPGSAHNHLLKLLDLKNEVIEGFNLIRHIEDQLKVTRSIEKNETIEKWRTKFISPQESLKYWNTTLKSRKILLKLAQKFIEKNNSNPNLLIDISTESSYTDLIRSKLLRKTGLYAEAEAVLSKITPKEKTHDSYLKSAEEVKLNIASNNFDNALSLANYYSQPDSFAKEIVSEFRRCKGKIYSKLNEFEMASRCYKNAFQLNPKNFRALLGLGQMMSEQYLTPTPAQALDILDCFLVGIQQKLSKYKTYVPRILCLLEISEYNDKINEYIDKIAPVCKDWLFQIFKRIDKPHGKALEGIVKYHVDNNPQAVFFALRGFVENREVHIEKSLNKALAHVYMELKKNHFLLIQNLEYLCDSLTIHFKPSLEEDLYSVFSNLIYSPTLASGQEYKEIFDLIFSKFFAKENEEFIEKYYEDFRISFNESIFNSPDTVLKAMKKWKDKLQDDIKQYETRYIDQDCSELSNFYSKEIEIPLSSDNIITLERIHPKIQTIKSKNCNKVITFKASNYKEYDFLISFQSSPNTYNISTLINSLQQLFSINNNKTSHRLRASNFESQLILPLGSRYYLIELKHRATSLKDVYDLTVDEEGVDPDFWIENKDLSVPGYLFTSYIQRLLQSPNRFTVFKKQFTAQWSLMYVFCMLFNVSLPDIQLNKIWVCLKSGVISFSMFDVELLESNQGEFRLTPNILDMIGQAGVAGFMPTVIINAFEILKKELPQVYSAIKLVLDDKKLDYGHLQAVVNNNSDYNFIIQALTRAKTATTDSEGWIPLF